MVGVVRTKIIFIVVDRIARSWQTSVIVTSIKTLTSAYDSPMLRFYLCMSIVGAHEFHDAMQRHSSTHFNDSPICGLTLVVDRYRREQFPISRGRSCTRYHAARQNIFFKRVFVRYGVCVVLKWLVEKDDGLHSIDGLIFFHLHHFLQRNVRVLF